MFKETLTFEGICYDLKRLVKWQPTDMNAYRIGATVSFLAMAVIVWLALKRWWLVAAVSLFWVYHLVCGICEYGTWRAKKRAVDALCVRSDISVTTVKLNAITEEYIYQPHGTTSLFGGATLRYHRCITVYSFSSGARFRVPPFKQHYAWSREFHITSKGLENMSVPGDAFYFVSLQGFHDVAYIYPCKRFALAPSLEI